MPAQEDSFFPRIRGCTEYSMRALVTRKGSRLVRVGQMERRAVAGVLISRYTEALRKTPAGARKGLAAEGGRAQRQSTRMRENQDSDSGPRGGPALPRPLAWNCQCGPRTPRRVWSGSRAAEVAAETHRPPGDTPGSCPTSAPAQARERTEHEPRREPSQTPVPGLLGPAGSLGPEHGAAPIRSGSGQSPSSADTR